MTARRAVGQWTLTYGHDYVDVTAFGDVTRTYITGVRTVIAEYQGTLEDGEEVRLNFPWNRRTQEAVAAPEPAPAPELPDLRNPLYLYNNTYFQNIANLAVGTTTNTATTGTINFNGTLDREAYDRIQRRLAQFGLNDYGNMFSFGETAEQKAEREAADARAMELLRSHLNKTQLFDLEKGQFFFVFGQKLIYKIAVGRNATVFTKEPHGTFCINPRGGERIPSADQALALKLLIEADEKEFLLTGNWSGTVDETYYSLARMSIEGKPSRSRGYTSRVYGQPKQPTDKQAAAAANDAWYFGNGGWNTINETRNATFAITYDET